MKLLKILPLLLLLSACGDDTGIPGDPRDLPVLKISDKEIVEGNIENEIELTVTLDGSIEANVVVDYSTVSNTALSEEDFKGAAGQLIFKPNEKEKVITIEIEGDNIPEADEVFEVLLYNPVNATVNEPRAKITLKDDDAIIADGPYTVPETGYDTPETYDGYELVWRDEFDTPTLNEDNWSHEIGNGNNGWGNNELQYYQPENTYMLEDDYMVIEAREQSVSGYQYTSSRIITQGKKQFKYGRIDIRAVMPRGQGIWPALWMLGANYSAVGWPMCGEIDIMELLGHDPGKVYGTVHLGSNLSNHTILGSSRVLPNGERFSDEFHVYSILWEEDKIQFLVDDVMYHEVTPEATNGQPYPFNAPFFFIFNIAVGGNWPGAPDDTTLFPQRMAVDYVRVFQAN